MTPLRRKRLFWAAEGRFYKEARLRNDRAEAVKIEAQRAKGLRALDRLLRVFAGREEEPFIWRFSEAYRAGRYASVEALGMLRREQVAELREMDARAEAETRARAADRNPMHTAMIWEAARLVAVDAKDWRNPAHRGSGLRADPAVATLRARLVALGRVVQVEALDRLPQRGITAAQLADVERAPAEGASADDAAFLGTIRRGRR